MKNKYIPINCHFYDELEALAIKKIKAKILYLEKNKELEVENFIIDFKNLNKEEFLVLSSGQYIRLDKIIKINDLLASSYSSCYL
ncbi:hypothetical protein CP985_12525 [Malaciobacter mytili LMG 24559]|uniref:Rho-binding antiterminator n=1 Tax=Malaciobacter mytili LMG 24559 TaxID=1032238 RepID=A0AAX2AC36_9BACT|nr:hypothetical protein [Malaciobacter mytili]AXH16253.1 hypothetical protein AMYT_2730 [Malaciobacter mytili LMG 24559]RXK13766.1 hypothetical protein CP985_12525 [Malaciobacter mytili LMG 24559]